jgi:hypothetical protein
MNEIGSFSNPVWTQGEVGAIYSLGIVLFLVIVVLLMQSTRDMLKDLASGYKWLKNRINKKA